MVVVTCSKECSGVKRMFRNVLKKKTLSTVSSTMFVVFLMEKSAIDTKCSREKGASDRIRRLIRWDEHVSGLITSNNA